MINKFKFNFFFTVASFFLSAASFIESTAMEEKCQSSSVDLPQTLLTIRDKEFTEIDSSFLLMDFEQQALTDKSEEPENSKKRKHEQKEPTSKKEEPLTKKGKFEEEWIPLSRDSLEELPSGTSSNYF